MTNASGTEGRRPVERTEADPLFPADGNFNTVVPLSEVGAEAEPSANAAAAPEEQDEATLVPSRARRGTRAALTPPAKGIEQSRALLAAVIILSVTAGVVAGAFMVRSQRPAPSAEGGTTPAEVAGTILGTETAAETSIPQPSGPAPQTDGTSLAVEPRPAAPAEKADAADTNAERADAPTPSGEATPSARRAAGAGPRAERRARAAAEPRAASPAPRPAQAGATTRRTASVAERRASTAAVPVSSPPPSARPKKVIQWP